MIKKTISAILVITFIFALCVVSTYAAVSYSASLNYYGPSDTQADASMTATGDKAYAMDLWIESHSTGESDHVGALITSGSASLTTKRVNINYSNVTEYPVVKYSGVAAELE